MTRCLLLSMLALFPMLQCGGYYYTGSENAAPAKIIMVGTTELESLYMNMDSQKDNTITITNVIDGTLLGPLSLEDPVRGIAFDVPLYRLDANTYHLDWQLIKQGFVCKEGQAPEECDVLPYFNLNMTLTITLPSKKVIKVSKTASGKNAQIVVEALWKEGDPTKSAVKGSFSKAYEMYIHNYTFKDKSCSEPDNQGKAIISSLNHEIKRLKADSVSINYFTKNITDIGLMGCFGSKLTAMTSKISELSSNFVLSSTKYSSITFSKIYVPNPETDVLKVEMLFK